jgi:tripartite-type tricarboxylate transporter receptor subunit TctC
VRFIVPFAAGGPVEIPARFIAAHLSSETGQNVIVEPRPGAGGALGIQHVVQTDEPHTLLFTTSAVAALPALLRHPGFEPIADLTPITLVADAPMALLVPAASPLGDLDALLAAARARPGTLSFGSSGSGSTTHLAGALFAQMAGIALLHVPYRGAAQAVNALYAGDTDLMVTGMAEAMPHLRDGRLRALAITAAERLAVLPAVPAAAERVPGYAISIWYAIFGPRHTPPEVVARLAAVVAPLRAGSALARRMTESGAVVLLDGPSPLAARLAAEVPRWRALARAANLQPE